MDDIWHPLTKRLDGKTTAPLFDLIKDAVPLSDEEAMLLPFRWSDHDSSASFLESLYSLGNDNVVAFCGSKLLRHLKYKLGKTPEEWASFLRKERKTAARKAQKRRRGW